MFSAAIKICIVLYEDRHEHLHFLNSVQDFFSVRFVVSEGRFLKIEQLSQPIAQRTSDWFSQFDECIQCVLQKDIIGKLELQIPKVAQLMQRSQVDHHITDTSTGRNHFIFSGEDAKGRFWIGKSLSCGTVNQERLWGSFA